MRNHRITLTQKPVKISNKVYFMQSARSYVDIFYIAKDRDKAFFNIEINIK